MTCDSRRRSHCSYLVTYLQSRRHSSAAVRLERCIMSLNECPLIVSSSIRTRPSCCGSERGTVCLNTALFLCCNSVLTDHVRLLGATSSFCRRSMMCRRQRRVDRGYDKFGVLGIRWTRSQQRHLYTRLLHHVLTTATPYWQVHRRSRLTSSKECSTLLLASLPVPTSSTGVSRGCCTPSCTGSTYLSESHTSSRVIMFGCQHGRAPQYLMDYCLPVFDVASRQHLRSASRRLLVVPRHRLSTYGRRAFAVAGPTAWNSFLDNLQDPDVAMDNFKCLLKTFLFSAYQCN